jgi:hypothetical protein
LMQWGVLKYRRGEARTDELRAHMHERCCAHGRLLLRSTDTSQLIT